MEATMKTFYLARRSDNHRFDGTKIQANDAKDAETIFARMQFNMSNLYVVGARS
jgi:hypothetical protein